MWGIIIINVLYNVIVHQVGHLLRDIRFLVTLNSNAVVVCIHQERTHVWMEGANKYLTVYNLNLLHPTEIRSISKTNPRNDDLRLINL